MRDKRNWWGLRCLMQECPHVTTQDETGIWGQCIWCGHKAGFVSRAELLAYATIMTAERPDETDR